MKNNKALPHKEIIERLSHHGIETKHDETGKLLVLDCSSYKGQLVQVWVDAPTTAKTLNHFLGY